MFTNLTLEEKEAFFALLDEYFESRPHLLGGGAQELAAAAAPAAAAIQRTVANNPQAAANLVTSGTKTFNKWNNAQSQSHNNSSTSNSDVSGDPSVNDRLKPGLGKVAAAAANLSAKGISRFGATPPPPSSSSRSSATPLSTPSVPAPPAPVSATRPPIPHSRTSSTTTSTTGSASRINTPSGLLSTRAIGDVRTTSFGSALSSTLPKKHFGTPPPPPAPPAVPSTFVSTFARSKNDFAPPPKRTVPATRVPTPPPPEYEPEPEPEGNEVEEWAKALYDFTSTESGDLPLKEKQHVRVIEHTSADWWTGEADGKRGLFPSAYVEIINV